jgi:hypothetical protein
MTIKLRALVKHPSRVVAETGLSHERENGVDTFSLDLGAFAESATIADQEAATLLLVTPGATESDPDVYERIAVDDFLAIAVNFDAELAAIAGLTSAADTVPYFTGHGTAALAGFTAFGRSLVDDANAGEALTTLGVSAFMQTVLDDADAAAALTTFGISAFVQTILDDADAAAVRATLGLVIGTDVQAQDAFLTSIAALGTAADRMIYTTGVDTAAETPITAFARTLLDDADAATARATLGTPASATTLTAGAGLTGGGDLSANRTFDVGAGTGIAVNADNVALDTASTRNTDHTSVTLTAGDGLTGGGDISASRSFAVGAGTGITVNADDVALANMAQSTIKGRAAGAGTGAPTDLTATEATAILNAFVGDSGAGGTKGLVPAPATGDASRFLRGDGAFAAIPGGGDLLAANNLSDVADAATAFANIKQAATPAATGAVQLADAAAMEAQTAGRVVTADLQHRHPGHYKAWVRATGAAAISKSWNVSSISSLGTGQERVNLSITMSDTAYGVACSINQTSSGRFISSDTFTTTNFEIYTKDSTGVAADSGFFAGVLGDI